jgi:purine-nucleoside phosphorylase
MECRVNVPPVINPILGVLNSILPDPPEIALVLGSGLGVFVDELKETRSVATKDLPGYPRSTVSGHQGAVVSGQFAGKRLVCFQGRVHLYEGYCVEEVVLPVRVAHGVGALTLILTNAAGGIHPDLEPGSLMLITDHIDQQFRRRIHSELVEGQVPLRHERQRFFESSSPYSDRLIDLARAAALEEGIPLFSGVLGAHLGPSYETPAEVLMQRIMGVDAACMSTVAEAAEAARLGMEVMGISCITNRAAGLSDAPLDHADVIEVAARVRDKFMALLKRIIAGL